MPNDGSRSTPVLDGPQSPQTDGKTTTTTLESDLRSLSDSDLLARYDCNRFTSTILASRLQYIISHVCNRLLTNAFSPIIRDFHDFTATLSAGPGLDYLTPAVAQTLPVFFGSMRDAVAISVAEFGVQALQEGDVLICNDTFRAGTHPNDLCFMRPVFVNGDMVSVLSIRAHLVDIGGTVPGGFSGMKRDIYENGLIIPPTLLYRDDQPVRSAFSIVMDNARFGQLLLPDIQSTFQALKLGETLVQETVARYGIDAYNGAIRYSCDASAERAHHALRELPNGEYEGVDYIDCDGTDPEEAYRIALRITKRGDRAEVDFSGTSQHARTSLNGCWPDVKTAVSLALKSLLDPKSPYTSAWLRDIDIVVPSGTVVASEPPAASMLYWEPILSVYSATLNALNDVLGTRAQAAPSRAMHLHLAAAMPGAPIPWLSALSPVGGWGANSAGDADSGQMSICLNFIGVDVETVETEAPVVHLRKEYATDTGGPGLFRGGAGTDEDTLWPTDVGHFVSASRTKVANGRGARGGAPGGLLGMWYWTGVGANEALLRDVAGSLPLTSATPVTGMIDPETHEVDASGTYHHWAAQNPWVTPSNTVWRTRSDGGGGWGSPLERDPASVVRDVRDGYVSIGGAERDYGVIVQGDPDNDPENLSVDHEATARLRSARGGAAHEQQAEKVTKVAPTKQVERVPVEGTCPECSSAALAEYPILTESGWLHSVKCQTCLYSVSRAPGPRLGGILLVEDLLPR